MKKDPGVPSSAPFKEEVLREAEQRRLQVGSHLIFNSLYVNDFLGYTQRHSSDLCIDVIWSLSPKRWFKTEIISILFSVRGLRLSQPLDAFWKQGWTVFLSEFFSVFRFLKDYFVFHRLRKNNKGRDKLKKRSEPRRGKRRKCLGVKSPMPRKLGR